jgi:hypothetical protein
VRIAATTVELVLLGRLFGECRHLFFGLSLILQITVQTPLTPVDGNRSFTCFFAFRGGNGAMSETPRAG